jgi:hypothetical protein
MRGFNEDSKWSDLRAEANWGRTKYSKTKTKHPALRIIRNSRGIGVRFLAFFSVMFGLVS